MLLALEATWLLTQDADPGSTTIVDARNGFNDLSRLEMLRTVCHRWAVGSSFAFNCYMHWAHLLIHQSGDTPFILLGREGVTQGETL